MKKKFLAFTLCFTLIFSSLSYKKSYADGGVISLPLLATVSALAVGTGIVINNNDDIYDLGRMFYDYVDTHNEMTWQSIQAFFLSSVSLLNNRVSVDSKFLDFVKDFLDNSFTNPTDKYVSGVPTYPVYAPVIPGKDYGDFYINEQYEVYLKMNLELYPYEYRRVKTLSEHCNGISFSFDEEIPRLHWLYKDTPYSTSVDTNKSVLSPGNVFPYNGGYSWDNLENKKENDNLLLPVPQNLGNLVGQGSSDFWGNTNDLVGNGDISIPSIDNPSIGIGGDTSFPGVIIPDVPGVDSPSVPNEGIWSTIKDFIIGLVVPSDTYWTDTWGGLYNNFTNSFPMVDVDGFNDLVTGEKKFPNIDINIMGVTGRVVNGDIINSIVDWLRPIIAGFMMLCLMLFNYRKIYKLIRNSEPFGGIAPGTSDFSTGISEYSKQEVVKATDMVAEYRAWKERGGK